jgi:hypothetical protein
MVRISKQSERRGESPRKRPVTFAKKTGPKVDTLEKGFKEHANALTGELAAKAFIPKIK